MLNPKALEAFRSIVVTGSTTAAAETMHISQPAVSRLLKSLELSLGYALFERVRGRLSPTPEGQTLFEEVERFFDGLEHLERVAHHISSKQIRPYRVAAMPMVGMRFLPRVISRMGALAELPIFSLTVVPSQNVAGLMLSRKCDLGFLSGVIDEAGMQVVAKYAIDCFCLLPPKHPLEKREAVEWSDFAAFPMASLDATNIVGSRVVAKLKAARIQPTVNFESHLTSVISAAVMNGFGIAVADLFTAQEHMQWGGTVRPLAEPIQCDFMLVKPNGSGGASLHRPLMDAFAAEVDALAALMPAR